MSRIISNIYMMFILSVLILAIALFTQLWTLVIITLPVIIVTGVVVLKHAQSFRRRKLLEDPNRLFIRVGGLQFSLLQATLEGVMRTIDSNGVSTYRYITDEDRQAIKQLNLLLDIINPNNLEISNLIDNHLEQRPTDPIVYRDGVILMYGMLIQGRIKDFVSSFKQFDETLYSRTEFRVMGRKPGEISLLKSTFKIDYELLKSFYKLYAFNEDVHKDILMYMPGNLLHTVLYGFLIEGYAKYSENPEILTDYKETIDTKNKVMKEYELVQLNLDFIGRS